MASFAALRARSPCLLASIKASLISSLTAPSGSLVCSVGTDGGLARTRSTLVSTNLIHSSVCSFACWRRCNLLWRPLGLIPHLTLHSCQALGMRPVC